MTIPLFKVFMTPSAEVRVAEVLKSLYIGQGTKVDQFEEELKRTFQLSEEIITVNSGTSAIDLALHMIGVGKGDEVITTPITCTATNSNLVNRGATPVWADVNPYTGVIDPNDVEKKITKKTKAIIAVNWGGVMPDYTILRSFDIPVIEDAAHGPYWSSRVRGNYITWSFQAIKHLTCGDGGALVSPDPDRARLLRWYGLDRRSSKNFRCEQNIQEIGYKYHMNDIAAVIGLANLPHLRFTVLSSRTNATVYTSELKQHISKTLLYVPEIDNNSSYWIYTVLVDNPAAFMEHMKKREIDTSPVHARNDKHDAFKRVQKKWRLHGNSLPGVDFFDSHQVSIPNGWWLTQRDKEAIMSAVKEYAI